MATKKKTPVLKPGQKQEITPDIKFSAEKQKQIAALSAKLAELQKELDNIQKLQQKVSQQISTTKTEYQKQTSSEKEKYYFDLISKNCSEFIQQIYGKGVALYRGAEDAPDVYIGKPFDKRVPRDSDPKMQAGFDAALEAAGFSALRRNSVFCTGDIGQAMNYGTVYLMFPKNGYKFTWSTKVHDLTNDEFEQYQTWQEMLQEVSGVSSDDFYHSLNRAQQSLESVLDKFDLVKQQYPKVKLQDLSNLNLLISDCLEGLTSKGYFISKLNVWIKKFQDFSSKVLMKDKGFAAFLNSIAVETNPKKLRNMQLNLVKNLGYRNTDILAAIKSHNEIFLSGEYYAVSTIMHPELCYSLTGSRKIEVQYY